MGARWETVMNVKSAFLFLFAPAALLTATVDSARAADGPQAVTLTTGDGAKLAARYFPGDKDAKSPSVIVLDDLGDEARPTRCDDIARQLAKDGCTVLCFDFRGCGRSREVEPEFWDSANNQQLVKGYKADGPPETIRFADFKPGYLPTLVNDVAAARAHLERRNDARECNTGQTYVIGFGRGAALGQIWVPSEWSRFRVSGSQNKVSSKPEGRDVAGCIWIGPQFTLDRPVPMFDLMKKSLAKKSTLVGLVHDPEDTDGARFARQCQDAFNLKDKAPLVAVHTARNPKSLGSRGEVAEQIGKFVAGMRKLQEQPLWENRNFGDRRYVWAFRGGPILPAKDEGDDFFQPIPVDQLLGKR